MKRANGRKTGSRWQALVYVVLVALVVAVLTGCEEAGTGDGAAADTDSTPVDDGETSGDGGDSGDEGTTTDDSSTLDTSAMVLHLGFDGDLSDETGNSSSMTLFDVAGDTLTGGYDEDRHSGANGSLEFDGTYAMKVEDIDLSTADSITVTAWVRDDGSETEKYRRIVAYQSGVNYDEFTARIRELNSAAWQDGSFEAFLENTGTNGTRTTEFVMAGSWVHVAMVYDGDTGELVLYQDGERKNSRALALDIADGNLIIGGGKNNEEFHGRIDDVAVFTRALTDNEIALAKDQIGTN